MKKVKKNYRSPDIEEIRLDKEISLQFATQSSTSPEDPFKPAPGAAPSGINRQSEDPYQYDNW